MTIPVVFRDHFQAGYVVRDLDKAMANMRDKFGVAHWQVRRLPEGAPSRALGFAYVQTLMIELIELWPDQARSIYHDWIPDIDTQARFHHLGYLIDSEAQWYETIAQFEAGGIRPALAGGSGDILDYYYADTLAELGHYCELVRLKPAGKNFWANVPHN